MAVSPVVGSEIVESVIDSIAFPKGVVIELSPEIPCIRDTILGAGGYARSLRVVLDGDRARVVVGDGESAEELAVVGIEEVRRELRRMFLRARVGEEHYPSIETYIGLVALFAKVIERACTLPEPVPSEHSGTVVAIYAACPPRGDAQTIYGLANVLIEAFLSREYIDTNTIRSLEGALAELFSGRSRVFSTTVVTAEAVTAIGVNRLGASIIADAEELGGILDAIARDLKKLPRALMVSMTDGPIMVVDRGRAHE